MLKPCVSSSYTICSRQSCNKILCNTFYVFFFLKLEVCSYPLMVFLPSLRTRLSLDARCWLFRLIPGFPFTPLASAVFSVEPQDVEEQLQASTTQTGCHLWLESHAPKELGPRSDRHEACSPCTGKCETGGPLHPGASPSLPEEAPHSLVLALASTAGGEWHGPGQAVRGCRSSAAGWGPVGTVTSADTGREGRFAAWLLWKLC